MHMCMHMYMCTKNYLDESRAKLIKQVYLQCDAYAPNPTPVSRSPVRLCAGFRCRERTLTRNIWPTG